MEPPHDAMNPQMVFLYGSLAQMQSAQEYAGISSREGAVLARFVELPFVGAAPERRVSHQNRGGLLCLTPLLHKLLKAKQDE